MAHSKRVYNLFIYLFIIIIVTMVGGAACYGVPYALYTGLSLVDRATHKLIEFRRRFALTDEIETFVVSGVCLLTY